MVEESGDVSEEERFKATVVATILDFKPEQGLDMLCAHYHVVRPRLGVGVVKGRGKGVRAVYSMGRKEILAAKREYFYDPFVMVHEFYHHLRSVGGVHRGTEKDADKFALDYLRAFDAVVKRLKQLESDRAASGRTEV